MKTCWVIQKGTRTRFDHGVILALLVTAMVTNVQRSNDRIVGGENEGTGHSEVIFRTEYHLCRQQDRVKSKKAEGSIAKQIVGSMVVAVVTGMEAG